MARILKDCPSGTGGSRTAPIPEDLDGPRPCRRGGVKTGGNLRIVTDYPEYFELITELMEANKNHLESTEFLPTASAKDPEWVGTNFKRKYLKQQRLIFRLAVRKI